MFGLLYFHNFLFFIEATLSAIILMFEIVHIFIHMINVYIDFLNMKRNVSRYKCYCFISTSKKRNHCFQHWCFVSFQNKYYLKHINILFIIVTCWVEVSKHIVVIILLMNVIIMIASKHYSNKNPHWIASFHW